ncbi:TonB-dependent receptor [Marivirga sp.]|uniref:TonB-dependent receptor n=1 Tax=Marivirga sp. TaxID=2018662 RepID=UPI002D7F1E41|nr:carboxypeptidase-like regulatory domain-containing protein [Marivirga sp.]HET8859988.1 carboxypeptidase-like regulatory domain-containing protein [Marivirga sp.]
MKKVLLLLLVFISTLEILKAQVPDQKYNFKFDSLLTVNALKQIEDKSGFQIYYKTNWLEGKYTTADLQNASIEQVLSVVLTPLELFSFIDASGIYITSDKKIVSKFPLIEEAIKADEQGVPPAGLMFKNDYVIKSDSLYRGRVITVGKQANFKENTKSLISGKVTDIYNNPIKDAIIYTKDMNSSTTSDDSGNFLLSVSSGKVSLRVQRMGYIPVNASVVVYSDGQLDFVMSDDIITLNEVSVLGGMRRNVSDPMMGVNKMNIEDVKNVPVILGEKDIINVATTYPGIQKSGEAAAGFNVRGGKSDQNLILYDGNTVYNINHFFGFFSAFNSDLLQSLDIYTSSIPAEFGGRLSSIFDINTKTPSMKDFNFELGVSPITAKLKTEIPIIENKAGLMLGFRATYSNWILKRLQNVQFNQNRVSFSDFSAVYAHQLDKDNSVKLSLYNSNDYFNIATDTLLNFSDFRYQNNLASVKWNHTFDEYNESEFRVGYTGYNYQLQNAESDVNAFEQTYGLQELNTKFTFSHYYKSNGNFKFGLESKLYNINPGTKTALNDSSEVSAVNIQSDKGIESALFASSTYSPVKSLKLDLGLRFSNFMMLGARNVPIYLDDALYNSDNIIDSISYGPNEIVKDYWELDYRLSLSYLLNKKNSFKASFNKTTQYIHSLSNSASLSPTDIWVLSNTYIKPQISNQFAIGFYKNLDDNKYETSIDLYYKFMQNLIDFKTGSNFILNENVEQVVLQGPGRSYGAEFSIKKSGDLNGWFNYTYSRAFIKLDGDFVEETINQGQYFRTNYDQPHAVNLVANYKLTQRVSLSMNGSYKTGRPITYPTGEYTYRGKKVIHYGNRNAFRIPDYFRIDFGINLEEGHKLTKNLHSSWSLSIYNLLGRDNIYSVYFDYQNNELQGYELSVFNRPIPTLTFNLRFL